MSDATRGIMGEIKRICMRAPKANRLFDAKARVEHMRDNKHKDQHQLFRMPNFAQAKEG